MPDQIKNKTRVLVMFSGGLDSMLAARILMDQGIETAGVCFESGFFDARKAEAAAKTLGIELKKIDIGAELLAIVKNPPSGYGKHLNPCIDCHALMARKAGEAARKENYDFVASGEVLGQRPFSQNRAALDKVQKEAGVEILRPLSAKLLPETSAEKRGIVKRWKLSDISGRSRERQMAMAAAYGLNNYATPAGGCLLTDPDFSERLLRMMEYWPDFTAADVELLKNGRVFWFERKRGEGRAIAIVGRCAEDNGNLEALAQTGDIMIRLKEVNGPTTIIRIKSKDRRLPDDRQPVIEVPAALKMSELKFDEPKSGEEIIKTALILTAFYAVKARGRKAEAEIILI